MKDFAKALAWLDRQAGSWRGRATTRKALAEQATSDTERDKHLLLMGEYERRALAAGHQ